MLAAKWEAGRGRNCTFTFYSWTLDLLSSDECDLFCSKLLLRAGPGSQGRGRRVGDGPERVALCGAPGALVSAQSSSSGSRFLERPYSDRQPRSGFSVWSAFVPPLLHPPWRGLDPRHTAEERSWARRPVRVASLEAGRGRGDRRGRLASERSLAVEE